MANNLKKVSGLNPMNPDQMEATDLFYYVHAEDESYMSWSLTLADLFIGSNNLTSDIKFNNDTLYIKSGKIGINGSPDFTQTVQINGSLFVSTYANVSSYLITGGNITAGNDILAKGSITSTFDITAYGNLSANGSATINGSSSINGDLFVYGITSVNSLQSTNVNPRTTYTELINIIYPVGSIYTSTISTNPNTLFGIGTWVSYGEGRVLVGKAASGTFSTPGTTGGAETVTLTSAQSGVPAHSHPIIDKQHNHTFTGYGRQIGDDDNAYLMDAGAGSYPTTSSYTGITGTENNTPINASQAHNNLQPYVVVYMWRRTA